MAHLDALFSCSLKPALFWKKAKTYEISLK